MSPAGVILAAGGGTGGGVFGAQWDVVSGYFNLGAAFFVLVSMALMLGRLVGGPTLYDRLLALNSFGTKTVLFLCVFCFVIDRPDGIDIAILYALMNFIATVAVLKFFRYRALDVGLTTAHVTARDDEA